MQGISIDPEREITVCCGSTEAMMSAMMAIINPGDEVVVFEPFLRKLWPGCDSFRCFAAFREAATPPEWTFDRDELAAAFGPATKAIILNTPNNPTGKVFTRAELEFIRDLCVQVERVSRLPMKFTSTFCMTAREHISMARLDGMRERTITINGMSKTYSVTGWRVGWAIAPSEATQAIRKVHDFLTVGAAAPLQEAGAMALRFPTVYYDAACHDLREKARTIAEDS